MNDREKKNPSFVESLAGDTNKGCCDATALPSRLSRYSVAHHRALDMADYINANHESEENSFIAQKLKECGSYLIFRDYYTLGEIRLHSMCSCKQHLICPLCAIRRGAKAMKAYLDKLEVVKKDFRGIKAFLVTFTVKNGDDLLERFKHIQRSIQKYHEKRKQALLYPDRNITVEACKAKGAVWSYEFKRGKNSGLWHPHLHAIWLCYDEPDENQIRKEWFDITGDSHVVNVTAFYDQENVARGFLEVFKYAVKFADLPLGQNWEGFQVMRGKRLISSFGNFRGVVIPETLTDEPLENFPYVEMFYRFIRGAGYSYAGTADQYAKNLDLVRLRA